MSTEYFIGLDVHCSFSEFAAVSKSGRLVKRGRCPTAIPELVTALEKIGGFRRVTFEEGPLADWLARNLGPHVQQLVVCDPRRNHLVAKDGDKDDPIDALKLAQLFRGGYIKKVHQATSLARSLFKQQVGFYHDRVRERVRQGHQLTAYLRRHGIFMSIARLENLDERKRVWREMPRQKAVRQSLDYLWGVYELLCSQEHDIRLTLIRLARREDPVRRFEQLPGMGWIRSATFYAYVDTPNRFRSKSALWRYCGIGLKREHSGQGPMKTRLDHRANRRLKDTLLGAAKSAVQRADNPYADKYTYWTQEEGLHPSTARRNVARCQAATLWSLWKTGSRYDAAQVRGVGRPVVT